MVQRILLLTSADNGLTQRTALVLQRTGRTVRTAVVSNEADMQTAVDTADFDLIVCPYLKIRVPRHITNRWITIIVHPGPIADRGPHSLDWALAEGEPRWGVTALGATDELDAGPIWAWREFAVPDRITKSALYSTAVADAAVECILEAADRARDPAFTPLDQGQAPRPIPHARARPPMRQCDRAFDWADDPDAILQRIRASDGSPGVRTTLAGRLVHLFDAHPGRRIHPGVQPGTITGRRHHAIEIACGTGATIWIGHLRPADAACKGPAVTVLSKLGLSPLAIAKAPGTDGHDIRFQTNGYVGTITIDSYNGAFDTNFCRRLAATIRAAASHPIKALVLRGTDNPHWSNGIHLGAIEYADHPATEAWENLHAINEICSTLLQSTAHLVTIAALTGSAGAGGVMLALTADVVVARNRILLNPHYANLGLTGSELSTYTLPRRVGPHLARKLLADCLPVDVAQAADMGLVDAVGPDTDFDPWLDDLIHTYCDETRWTRTVDAKQDRLAADRADKPLNAILAEELAEMSRDIFDNRSDFSARRYDFLGKNRRPSSDGHMALTSAAAPLDVEDPWRIG
ncbi:enoyl-CoA hydratase-related protein [Nocardia sp. NPDC050710]|uniref:enoyl-CoA hydratase-related protein n=1 Tax=Nocardia sp. NPDC050710 TaxID=3157220 RepID=UPI0033DEC622